MSRRIHSAILTLALFGLVACGRSASPGAGSQPVVKPAGVVVTFKVADAETYKVQLTDPTDIEIARRLLAGQEAPTIPVGKVVRGTADVNDGYSWHIDPSSVEFADMTMEVCDGRPSDVEQSIITSDQFCPWSAEIVAIEG